ncbi:HAD-like domain-containing protein [Kockovaella imperatae]|uniref:HAD-like domain-containing protein n=1 Tax=Kockovaella imperatae TaxID=4999 RepID=A0A1Y1U5R6_9TREE|nr:HAD-like domain-containing protein [Kockovaella imperatae]ORX33381.1 HAD-like domain-containing protein [Kockovaella imperatae]
MDQVKVLLFDCFGTLIDWERGMYENIGPLLEQKTCPTVEEVITSLVNEQTPIQNADKTMPYPIVLQESYRQLIAKFRLHYDQDDAEALGDSVTSWPVFSDTGDCLARLRDLGLKLVILTNVDGDSFDQLQQTLEECSGIKFDAIYTADEIGSHKPDLRNFDYALNDLSESFNVSRGQVLCVAQNKLIDIEPANKIGIRCARINRPGVLTGHRGSIDYTKADFEFASLEEFTEEMERVHDGV